ncbi:MAG: GNAT family N-acetyltransferase [Methylotenera sp.]|nr:GNAT family N-acetyltransferase [Methylotenera sp.]MSQ00144.1 GNAT family N-acetyltransferase [Methylotenera sp.]
MSIQLKHIHITPVTWRLAKSQLREVRIEVFLEEQQVPLELEWDGLDEAAQHLLVMDDENKPIACVRLLTNGSIGRMAVVKAWRGKGVGSALLNRAITQLSVQGVDTITLSAQSHAITFYEKAGFVVTSQPYLEANMLHVDMQLSVTRP